MKEIYDRFLRFRLFSLFGKNDCLVKRTPEGILFRKALSVDGVRRHQFNELVCNRLYQIACLFFLHAVGK